MNITKLAALALSGTVAATCGAEEYYAYFAKDSDHPPVDHRWETIGNWSGNSGTTLSVKIGSAHNTVCDSPYVSPDDPVVLSSDYGVKSLLLGRNYREDGRFGALRITSTGTLKTTPNGVNETELCGRLIGGAGNGLLMVDEGGKTATSCMLLGRSTTGCGIVTNAGEVACINANQLYVGYEGKGLFVNKASGSLQQAQGNMYVGCKGAGTLVNSGSFVAPIVFIGGEVSNGVGSGSKIVHNGGKFIVSNLILVGNRHFGTLDLAANAVVSNGVDVGVESGATGELVIRQGGTLTSSAYYFGGRDYNTGTTSDALGLLTMRGGTLQTRSWLQSGYNVYLPFSPNAYAVVRGWGSFADVHDTGNNNVRMRMDGQVIADGEGDESHVLDLGRVVYSARSKSNGWTGTNGWYAVNKGKLVYPRKWLGSPGDWVIGENDKPSTIEQVNVLAGTINGFNQSLVIKAAQYAPDRSDIPAGLKAGRTRVGVWGVWVQDSVGITTRRTFGTTSLRIRYDHTKVQPKELLWLMRYNAQTGKWVALLNGVEQPATPILEVTDQACDSGQSMNVGWYAILAGHKRGLAVLIK